MLECSLNPSEWLVLDTGSHSLRLGFSGLPRPSLIVPTRGPLYPIDPQQMGHPEGLPQEDPNVEEGGLAASSSACSSTTTSSNSSNIGNSSNSRRSRSSSSGGQEEFCCHHSTS
ncbi:hypothetical protein ACSSS7_002741 [Eimeria intestinalis]